MWSAILSPDFFSTILRSATPILFATLAAAIAAKAGICNMALEGIMLFSALFGVIFSSLTHSAWLGLLITMVIGGLIGLILAFFILNLKTDEILAAIAINLTATGGTVLLLVAVSGDRGVSSSIRSVSAPSVVIPFIEKIPFIGSVLSGQNILTWFSILAVILLHLFLYKTPLGLAIRAVGENKNAAESVGIDVTKFKLLAFTISAALAGVAGVLYAHNLTTLTALPKNFGYNMSIMILVYVVLGGIGSIRGSVIATVILYLLPEMLRGLSNYRMLMYAIVLILAMLFNSAPQFVVIRERMFAALKGNKKPAKEAK